MQAAFALDGLQWPDPSIELLLAELDGECTQALRPKR
jgi:hypothetical protein